MTKAEKALKEAFYDKGKSWHFTDEDIKSAVIQAIDTYGQQCFEAGRKYPFQYPDYSTLKTKWNERL